MSDGKVVIDTELNKDGLEKGAQQVEKSARSRAASIAAVYRKQGMSQADAMKKAWSEIERDSGKKSKKTGDNIKKNIGGSTKSVVGQLGGLKSVVGKLTSLLASAFAVRGIINFNRDAIKLGSDLQEVQNVVDVTFRTMNEQVNAFAQNAANTAGLSETMAKRYAGTFGAMAKSFRFTEAEAYKMSTSLTQLSGDVASFYNISQDEAFTKLKSVFTGETETLKDLGVVMTQAALDQYALRNGINMTTSEMTEQQKVALRYNFVLERLATASGDFTRTSGSWANQTRVLATQFDKLKSAIGQGFINALTPVLQVINAVLSRLQLLAQAFRQLTASMFGDASAGSAGGAVTELGNAYDSAADSAQNLTGGIGAVCGAAKKAQKQLAGFDELTKISAPETGGVGGGVSVPSGGSFDFELGEIKPPDVTETIFDPAEVQRVADIMKTILDYIPVMAAGLAGLKLGGFISNLLTANIKAETLQQSIELIGKKAGLIGGITLSVTGVALETKGIISSIQNGLNSINFAEIVSGSAAIVTGGALIGNALGNAILGGAIGGIVAGLPGLFTGVNDALTNELSLLNSTLITTSTTMIGASLGALIGPVGAGTGALVGLVVGAVTDLGILIYQNWDAIAAYISEKLAIIGQCFSDLWEWIKSVWSTVSEWFNVNVITPVTSFFSTMWSGISNWAVQAWANIKNVFNSVASWFNASVIKPVSGFFANMWNGFKQGAANAWAGVKSVFKGFASWFKTIFTNAWQGIVNVFSVGGEIFVSIKDGIISAFKTVVNGIIKGINSVISLPFKGLNGILNTIQDISIVGLNPFSWLTWRAPVPQIPFLAKGAVIPPNAPFMAMLGDQRHGTNIEAPLSTIQEAVANVMGDQTAAILAGFEASVGVQRAILEAVLGIQIGDDVIGSAVERYSMNRSIINGGVL